MQDPYEPIPDRYSPELAALVAAILTKDDTKRPTVSQILETPFLEKYMMRFVKEREAAAKKERFENLASATAHSQQLTIPKVDPSKRVNPVKPRAREVKKRELTAKERMMLRKEQEATKKFEVMSSAAKTATQTFSE